MPIIKKLKREYTVNRKVSLFLILPMPETAKNVLRGLAELEHRTNVNQLSVIAGQLAVDLYDHYKFVQNKTKQKLNYLLMRDIKNYVEKRKDYKGLNTIVKKWKV